jgi:signal transduction histidine kinase/ligand-binding sensor domain-containing protein
MTKIRFIHLYIKRFCNALFSIGCRSFMYVVVVSFFFLNACYAVIPTADEIPFQQPQWQVREFLAPDVLGHQEVIEIVEKSDKSVWFATKGRGVTRLEPTGERTIFDIDVGLASNHASYLKEDRFGGMWVGTSKGISYIYKDKVTSFKHEQVEIIPNLPISAIDIDSQGNVWFGGMDSTLIYFVPDEAFPQSIQGEWIYPKQYHDKKPNNSAIEKLIFQNDKTLWLCKNVFIEKCNFNHEIKEYCYDNFGFYKGLLLTDNGFITVCREHLLIWDDDKFEIVKVKNRTIMSLESVDDYLLIGSRSDGLKLIDPTTKTVHDLSVNEYFQNPCIECITKASDGSIWIGTRSGAYRLSDKQWRTKSKKTDYSIFQSRTIVKDNLNTLYVIDKNENVYRRDAHEWNYIDSLHLEAKTLNDKSFSLFFCDNYFIYKHAEHCLKMTIHPNQVTTETIPWPGENAVFSDYGNIYLDNSDTLWQTHFYGTFQWDGSSWKELPQLVERPIKTTFFILEIEPLKYWVLGRGWIEEWSNGQGRIVDLPDSYTRSADQWSKLYCAVKHNDAIWIATDRDGILKYNQGVWEHLHHEDGLPGDGIYSLYSASDGVLWVGSKTSGIASYKDGLWIQYMKEEGIPSELVNQFVEDRDGNLWVGIQFQGLVQYCPDRGKPIVWIESGSKNLISNEQAIISFKGRDQWNNTKQKDLFYSWRIIDSTNNPVTDWSNYSHITTITTPRMNAGEYEFQVLAQDKDRNISLQPAVMRFVVQPYFWMTPQFQVPVLASITISILLLVLWFIKHLQLLTAKALYQNLVEKDTVTLILYWDQEGKITYMNESAKERFAPLRKNSKTISIDRLLTDRTTEQQTILTQALRYVLNHPDVVHNCRLRTHIHESDVWISWFFRNVDNKIHAVGVDVTSQVSVEHALSLEKTSIREFCDSAHIGIMHIDEEMKIVYINNAMHTILGYIGDVNIRRLYDIDWFHYDRVLRFFQKVSESGRSQSTALEFKRFTDGETVYLLISAVRKQTVIECMIVDNSAQKQIEKSIAKATACEQSRLGRELHDGLSQQITGMAFLCTLLEDRVKDSDRSIKVLVDELSQEIAKSIDQSRHISRGLSPVSLSHGDFKKALEEQIEAFQKTYRTSISLDYDNSVSFALDEADHLYRIIREATFNALKHSQADSIGIRIYQDGHTRNCIVYDNGVGFPPEFLQSKQNGMGFNLMELHASAIDATIEFSPNNPKGTAVQIRL